MYNYLPHSNQKSSSSFSIIGFIFKFFIFIILLLILIYIINTYQKIKESQELSQSNTNSNINSNTNNYPKNITENQNSESDFVLEEIDLSEEICNSYTSNSILDENTPEMGGLQCLQNYILRFGNQVVGQNKYELKYNSTNNNRYLLDLEQKVIHFYNENGLLEQNRFCLFSDPDNSGCVLN